MLHRIFASSFLWFRKLHIGGSTTNHRTFLSGSRVVCPAAGFRKGVNVKSSSSRGVGSRAAELELRLTVQDPSVISPSPGRRATSAWQQLPVFAKVTRKPKPYATKSKPRRGFMLGTF